MKDLLDQTPRVICLGIEGFAGTIEKMGGEAVETDWRPPAGGNRALAGKLAAMLSDGKIDKANETAFARYLGAQPVLEAVAFASDVIPELNARLLLHAGPPVDWDDMCGPMRGALAGAAVYEGWANTVEQAAGLAAAGKIDFAPCHHHGIVGPMCGVVSAHMPVWVVHNKAAGNRSYATFNEGLGKVLRFGANDEEVFTRLAWMRDGLMPVMQDAVAKLGGLDLKSLMAQALHMGDEVHNRNAAATGLLFKQLTIAALKSGRDADAVAQALDFVAGNDHFFLNLSMAACKAMLDAAHGVSGSSLVTAMARNGVEFGIKVSGCGDQWFTAPAPLVDGLYFPGYSMADAAPDLGDSAITETAGLGGFAMAAAPAIVQFVGGSPADAVAQTREMYQICHGVNHALTLPTLDFAGTPAGIDLRKVLDRSIEPVINTGIAHAEPGVGQIGAGITRAPMACFIAALEAFDAEAS
jgi:hypothetical protein